MEIATFVTRFMAESFSNSLADDGLWTKIVPDMHRGEIRGYNVQVVWKGDSHISWFTENDVDKWETRVCAA